MSVSPSVKCLTFAGSDMDVLALHRLNAQRYPFLLQSVAHGQLGRYDILFAFPQEKRVLKDAAEAEAFQQGFHEDYHALHTEATELDLPFSGGWFGYFSYEYAQVVEPSLALPASDLPLAVLVRIPAAVIVDHLHHQWHLVAEVGFEDCLADMQRDLEKAQAWSNAAETSPKPLSVADTWEEPESKYLNGIQAIKDYILAGDIFQVNLSREWRFTLASGDYVEVYAALRRHNPAPFAACAQFGDWQLLSSSPERLVRTHGDWVEARPIAGTRKRLADAAGDRALVEELISHPKERAEHIMLIDLVRNDLGRICVPGTVEVNELMVVESYEHVHHIVSNVRGHLQAGMTPLEVLHATFPGGTITGCPKVRCMEIIAELEQAPRQAYTGSLGYINRDGSMDFNILIRSFLQRDQQLSLRTGAGIVADSVAERELQEARHKAKGLLNALSAGAGND